MQDVKEEGEVAGSSSLKAAVQKWTVMSLWKPAWRLAEGWHLPASFVACRTPECAQQKAVIPASKNGQYP